MDLDIFKGKTELTEGVYTLTEAGGRSLAARRDGAGYVLCLTGGSGSEQRFRLEKRQGGQWEIISVAAEGYSLDVSGCSGAEGARVQLYPSNGTRAQRFAIEAEGGLFRIATAASSLGKYVGNTLTQISPKSEKTLWALDRAD